MTSIQAACDAEMVAKWRRIMSERVYRCYAFGTNGNWQGICVDLDISVQGSSFREVLDLLDEAITTYVDDALAEGEGISERLLARRAPWHVRVKLAFSSALHILRIDRNDDQLTASFDVPCHA
jgi:predicted RNase H-like HicB family nuclease